jgi:hypothetical protein
MKCPASAEAELKSSFMYMLKEQFNYNRPSFLAWQDGVEFFIDGGTTMTHKLPELQYAYNAL